MKTLSIRQPWAWLIANGYKNVENRTWETSFRGTFLIHASKTRDSLSLRDIFSYYELSSSMDYLSEVDLSFGGIVGIANLVDCVDSSCSRWFNGPYGFCIEDARPLPFYQCRGQLGFFEIDYPKSGLCG